MDSIIVTLILAFLGGAFYVGMGRKGKFKAKVLQFEKKDAELSERERQERKEVEELEKRLQNVEDNAKGLSPDKILDFWNDINDGNDN